MSYTQEQLNGMSDAAINGTVKNMLFGDNWHKEYALFNLDYCADWSVTGPLMVECGVALSPTENDNKWCAEQPSGAIDMFSVNQNPLRAVCEVILMM